MAEAWDMTGGMSWLLDRIGDQNMSTTAWVASRLTVNHLIMQPTDNETSITELYNLNASNRGTCHNRIQN